MIARYAQIIDDEIVNVILWDGEGALGLEGELLKLADRAPLGIGWTLVEGQWVAPPEPEEEPDVEEAPEPEHPLSPEEWIVT